MSVCRSWSQALGPWCCVALASPVLAFEWHGYEISSRSELSQGFAVRTDAPDPRLIGKLNIDGQQTLCLADGCSSIAGDPAPSARYRDAAGAFFGHNKDNGNLSFDQWSLVSANSKLAQEFTIERGDWRAKVSALGFFDPVNYTKDFRHPNTLYQPAKTPRSDSIRNTLGKDWALREAFVTGPLSLGGHDADVSVGWQRVRWGEANFLALNSLSQLNPPDTRLLHQPNTQIRDIFRPTPMFRLDAPIFDGVSMQFIYELGWVGVKLEPNGSFYSTLDIADAPVVNISVGNYPEDPDSLQRLAFPGNLLSDTSFTAQVLPMDYAEPTWSQALQGQAGLKLSAWLPDFNGGTELSFYALNYHSQLPYISSIAADASCARESTNIGEAFEACYGFQLNPEGKEALPLDSVKPFLDYPRNIQMFGASFNTNVGNWSLSGEYSIRPRMPLQVQVVDVDFAALQPAFPKQDIELSLQAIARYLPGAIIREPGAFFGIDPQKLLQFIQYALEDPSGSATIPGVRTAVPDFYQAYTGITVQPGQVVHGYVRLPVDQLDLTAIRVLGPSENPIGAEQIQFLVETGFTHVWNFPDISELQIEAGNSNNTHASPGVDGTGSGGVTNASRQNPTQQTDGFATAFSWGYRMLARIEYNDLLFGLNVKPTLFWGQDLNGVAPQPIQNFAQGNKYYSLGVGFDSGPQWTTQLSYSGSTGGGSINNQRDRDTIALSVSYSF